MTSFKRFLPWGLLALVVCALALSPAASVVRALYAQETTPAYTVTQSDYSINAATPQTRTLVQGVVRARDEDGAVMWEMIAYKAGNPGDVADTTRRIIQASVMRLDVDDTVQTKTTWYPTLSWYQLHMERPMRELNPAADCLVNYLGKSDIKNQAKIIGHESILGIPVTVIQTNPATTTWRAPSLGCLDLKDVYNFGTATTVRETSAVTIGKPDPALFAISAQYQEVLPTERLHRLANSYAQRYGATAPQAFVDSSAYLDDHYNQNHAKAAQMQLLK